MEVVALKKTNQPFKKKNDVVFVAPTTSSDANEGGPAISCIFE